METFRFLNAMQLEPQCSVNNSEIHRHLMMLLLSAFQMLMSKQHDGAEVEAQYNTCTQDYPRS